MPYFIINSLNKFARIDEIISATNVNAYEGISSSGDFLVLKERKVLFTSSAIISKNTNALDVRFVCYEGDDVVLGIILSKRFAKLEK